MSVRQARVYQQTHQWSARNVQRRAVGYPISSLVEWILEKVNMKEHIIFGKGFEVFIFCILGNLLDFEFCGIVDLRWGLKDVWNPCGVFFALSTQMFMWWIIFC